MKRESLWGAGLSLALAVSGCSANSDPGQPSASPSPSMAVFCDPAKQNIVYSGFIPAQFNTEHGKITDPTAEARVIQTGIAKLREGGAGKPNVAFEANTVIFYGYGTPQQLQAYSARSGDQPREALEAVAKDFVTNAEKVGLSNRDEDYSVFGDVIAASPADHAPMPTTEIGYVELDVLHTAPCSITPDDM
jgi:hypothetical protein